MSEPFTRRGASLVVLALVAFGAAPLQEKANDAPEKTGVLFRVDGAVAHPLSLSLRDLEALPKQVVRGADHGGEVAEFEGATLYEVLKKAGAPVGDKLRGPAASAFVVLEASDGYRTVFSLAELDPAFTDNVVLLALRRDSKPLLAAEGPLRVIVPHEKRHARWIRNVETMTVRLATADKPSEK